MERTFKNPWSSTGRPLDLKPNKRRHQQHKERERDPEEVHKANNTADTPSHLIDERERQNTRRETEGTNRTSTEK